MVPFFFAVRAPQAKYEKEELVEAKLEEEGLEPPVGGPYGCRGAWLTGEAIPPWWSMDGAWNPSFLALMWRDSQMLQSEGPHRAG